MSRILIVEDEASIRQALSRLLQRHGHQVTDVESVEAASEQYDPDSYHLILTDLRLPGAPGTRMLQLAPEVPVIVMTSYGSVQSAVEAMKLGAVDYIAKPFDHEELLMLIDRTLRQGTSERLNDVLKAEVEQQFPIAGMVGQCDEMRDVCSRIDKVAPTDATVLILGESGTGKELVARALHSKSKREASPFVVFNCAAVPEHLVESELFGNHQSGADQRSGLLEKADGGTLFLDEVGELPPAAQARLLRLLQSGEFTELDSQRARPLDVRIIAATHRDIRQLVQQERFRSDLYFRLRVVEMTLPPLRQRGDDIIQLAVFLLSKACQQLNRPHVNLSREAIEVIRRYPWPGNVRELENAMERAVILCEQESITPDLLAIDHEISRGVGGPTGSGAETVSLEEYFRRFVLEHQDRMTETELAQRLGISRKTLWERRQRFGIPRSRKNKN